MRQLKALVDSAAQHIEEMESGYLPPEDGDDDDDDDEEEDEHERETAVGGGAAPDTTAVHLAEPQVSTAWCQRRREQNEYCGIDLTCTRLIPHSLCACILHTHLYSCRPNCCRNKSATSTRWTCCVW